MLLYTASAVTGYLDPAMCRLSKLSVFLPMLLLLLPGSAAAVRVEGLYRAEVEVVDKGAEARAEGFRAALERVLVKVTGRSGVLTDEALEPLLESSARYVQQYRYSELDEDPDASAIGDEATGDGADGQEAEPAAQYRLQVVFARRRIDALLEEREIAVWDVYRPQVLVWLAFDDGRRRTLVAAEDTSGIAEALREIAERRGLPLLLPLLDTEDQRRVEYFDIQGGFLDRVREASTRYNAGLVVIGHVYRGGGGWRGEWTLLEGDERSGWLSRAGSAADAVHTGIGGLADRLAARMAGREGEERRVRIRIEDAAALNDYARLGRYFERLPRVDGHRVMRVRPRQLLFELSMRGQLSDLERAIALDNLLVPVRGQRESTEAGVVVPTAESALTVGGDEPTASGGDTAAATGGNAGSDPAGGPVYGAGGEDPAVGRGEADLVYRLAG